MTRGTAWFVHASTIAVGATGLVYGWMLYFAESDDPRAELAGQVLTEEVPASE